MKQSDKMACVLLLGLFLVACEQTTDDTSTELTMPNSSQCEGIRKNDMVWMDGGAFLMGDEARLAEEGPPREIRVDGFWISLTEVTNTQFAEFVEETGYVTESELSPPAPANAPDEFQRPGSAVFRLPTQENPNWWVWVEGAQWRHPDGPMSDLTGRANHPVVQVTYEDARAYANWKGLSVPTEAQWEYAARAGQATLPEPKGSDGSAKANYYQGPFPVRDTGDDGFVSRAPVGCFEPNAFGLYDMIGNVWEWTSNGSQSVRNTNVIKGGSYLCARNYCARYRPAARQFQERGLATDHIGFRVVDNQRPAPNATK